MMKISELKSSLEPHLNQDIVDKFESIYQELLNRREEVCPVVRGEEGGDLLRISQYSLALRQVFLHRTISTFTGAIVCLRENHLYSVVLSVRGNFETTAALGYLYGRLDSCANGTLTRERIYDDICVMLLGTRYEPIADAFEAKHVLTLLEHATKAVKKVTFADQPMPPGLLTERYNFLCDYCHPNYSSNSLAFHFDEGKGQLRMRHDCEMLKRETAIIENLLISAPLFIDLYDGIPSVLASVK